MEHEGDDRFSQVRTWIATVSERWGNPALTGLPMALGGFGFRARRVRGQRWSQWPDAAFFVPKRLLLRQKGETLDLRIDGPVEPLPGAVHGALREEPSALEARERYEALVHAAVNDIGDGALAKAVIARPATTRPEQGRLSAPAILRALRASHPHAVCFAMARHGEVFLGATPETLVAMRGGELATQAVAGTTRTALDADGQALSHSAKDDHEHALVVESIEAALRPLCGAVDVGVRRLVRAGDVQHIVTPVTGAARANVGVVDAVASLHPTAALCGTPREAAATWIAEHEGFDRGWYGAPIGWLSDATDGVFAVAIRSALVTPGAATAFVGAGVVGASEPAAEWDETEAKLGPVQRAIVAGIREGES